MSGFKNKDYIQEFACRTKLNYFNILNDNECNKRTEINELKNKMKHLGYDTTSKYYEVTQLINSLIGLFIFPEQKFFKKLPTDEEKFVIIKNLSIYTKQPDYKNTYEDEEVNEKTILKHMRNAICHRKLSIFPLSRKGYEEITDIQFRDSKKLSTGKLCEFQITIPVNDLESILMNLCDFFMNI